MQQHRIKRIWLRAQPDRNMSNKMASKAKKQAEPDQNTPEAAEAASLDAAQQTIKTLMKLGKERGFVTHDELNAALPAEDYTSEQIDDVMSSLSEMGVSVVDSAESDSDDEAAEEGRAAGNLSDSDVSGTDDPVRMYLRARRYIRTGSSVPETSLSDRLPAARPSSAASSSLSLSALSTTDTPISLKDDITSSICSDV